MVKYTQTIRRQIERLTISWGWRLKVKVCVKEAVILTFLVLRLIFAHISGLRNGKPHCLFFVRVCPMPPVIKR